ncbi:LOW QUALITY PROTEIN: hypothetical protein QBC45DRAFT_452648 [Copromyces sp. CBS 386.78]|nr:LOW QUALITY PROTEIN: hypothetical protein QBC45DRAFT_452648 [Copromyces sp. CBS 386.78]
MPNFFGYNFTSSDDPNWVPEPDRRGTFNILSTCLVTLGLCIAIHLNVLEYKEGKLLRKAGWMLLGLLSLEAAMNSGNNLSDDAGLPGYYRRIRDRGPWGFVTSFFTSSDSIEYEAIGALRTRFTLTPAVLRFLKNKGLEDLIPMLLRERINNKSKGSIFVKALVYFQSLSISLLEFNTLRYAICTLFIYHKLLNISKPETISLDARLTSDKLLNGFKLLAAMYVKSKLDNAVSEFTHLYYEEYRVKGFVFNIEYKYLEEIAAFSSTINKDIPYRVDIEQLNTTAEKKPYLLYSLVYLLLMEKYALKKNKLVPPIKCVVVIRKSDTLLEERIISNRRRPDVWGNVLLYDIDSKWREVEGRGKEKFYDLASEFLFYEYPDPNDRCITRPYCNPPQVLLVSRPFIDISYSDMRRWQLAMACEILLDVLLHLLIDRIGNLLRLEDYEKYTRLYIGFGFVSLIYGGLHLESQT